MNIASLVKLFTGYPWLRIDYKKFINTLDFTPWFIRIIWFWQRASFETSAMAISTDVFLDKCSLTGKCSNKGIRIPLYCIHIIRLTHV